jgi:UDP-glucose-4-epimerase GalE
MRVVVTGGAGYIGSHVVRALVRRGHEVLIYDNLSTGCRSFANGFTFIGGDIGDRTRLEPALRGAQAIMHFAAHAYVGESVEKPRKYFHNNVECALNLLNTAVEAGVKIFVFSSTCAVYGVPVKVPISEDHPREPINPYGATKLLFEHALDAYSKAYGLRFAALRYFNAAGADDSGEIGEAHDPETHLIPLALEAAGGVRTIEVFGSDYPTPDGTCIRDYIHVNDLAEAHALALEYLADGGGSLALNLGTGQGHSIMEVLAAVELATGRRPDSRYGPRRPGDPPALVADPTRAQQVLGWRAQRSLKNVVETAWRWMQNSSKALGSIQR